MILRHRLFVSDDSMSNYAHVWFIAKTLRHAHHLPWAMPGLGHGRALAYPYAFVPWTGAAVTWLAVGEWAVTLWLVLGAGLTIVATFLAFPELRPSRAGAQWTAAALVNPALVTSLWFGQLPFLWAVGFLLLGVAAWRRQHPGWALAMVALAQATHPAIVAPMALALVGAWWHWEPRRRDLLKAYVASSVLALPAAWFVVASPVFADSSTPDKLVNFVETFFMRMLVVAVPLAIAVVCSGVADGPHGRRRWSWSLALSTGALVGLGLGQFLRIYHHYPWRAPVRSPDNVVARFVASAQFEPGLTYRILRSGDGKVAMYQVLRAGGRLDSEFFPESQGRRRFGDLTEYEAFLRARKVDRVIAFSNYDRVVRSSNERELVRACGHRLAGGPFELYDVTDCVLSHAT